jgi:hypothetical protein
MDHGKLAGMDVALNFAREGKFIFAIKSLERANPGITRETAKGVIESFGYGKGSKRVEPEGDRGEPPAAPRRPKRRT